MRVLRKPDVASKVGLSGVHIMRLVERGTFPKPLRLGPGSIGWLETEIEEWIERKAEQRFVTNCAADSRSA